MEADPTAASIPVQFPTHDFNGAKTKRPMAIMPIPEPFLPFLGQRAVIWGEFERGFDEFLRALVKANGTTPKQGWQFLRFDQRQTSLKMNWASNSPISQRLSPTYFA